MRIIQCKVNQLWSANPIKAMKAFYDCQTRQVTFLLNNITRIKYGFFFHLLADKYQ
jgi:hypothetical protein